MLELSSLRQAMMNGRFEAEVEATERSQVVRLMDIENPAAKVGKQSAASSTSLQPSDGTKVEKPGSAVESVIAAPNFEDPTAQFEAPLTAISNMDIDVHMESDEPKASDDDDKKEQEEENQVTVVHSPSEKDVQREKGNEQLQDSLAILEKNS
ncbi:MAG: hypothetical protein GY822_25370 [Deltaproteobacteria bacterium]|nr:hypothetical protein [Deltaproteobacteria bacterium]